LLSARVLASAAWGCLYVLTLAPPILSAGGLGAAAAWIHFFFSPVCHQAPDRSFALLGYSIAVCHRCSGIYFGFFAGSLLRNPWIHHSPAVRRRWIVAASAPVVLDALLPFTGFFVNTWLSRFATGLLFGIASAALLVRGLSDIFHDAPWRRCAPIAVNSRGGL
jgi:uncharacterized membrane protein